MLDPVTTGIVVVLGKYVLDKGVELGKEVGPKALDTAKEIFTIALDRLRKEPKGEVIADEYEADPGTYEKPLGKELEKAVAADADFKAQMEALLQRFDEAAAAHATASGKTYTAVLKGSGAIAQGDGAKAAGEGAVMVDGNVSGPIVTGSGNVFNTERPLVTTAFQPDELGTLKSKLVRYFNKGELKGLCFDLGVPHDDLPSETRSELAQALVEYCHQRDKLPQLLKLCQDARPNADW